jgi:hypothetical protein
VASTLLLEDELLEARAAELLRLDDAPALAAELLASEAALALTLTLLLEAAPMVVSLPELPPPHAASSTKTPSRPLAPTPPARLFFIVMHSVRVQDKPAIVTSKNDLAVTNA